eukprot:11664587-Ditylum_brightwellii.AAC.1
MGGVHCGSIGDPYFCTIDERLLLTGHVHIARVVGASCVWDANYVFSSIFQGGVITVKWWTDMITK